MAATQIEKDSAPTTVSNGGYGTGTGVTDPGSIGSGPTGIVGESGKDARDVGKQPKIAVLRRFHGSAMIDATRLSRDVDLIASSVVQHLAGLLGAKVTVTVEIEAENCRTLKFDHQGFEES